jgi:large conductance mechanosensitive channel
VLDLAVAVVVGAAFTAVVNSLAKDVLLQIVAAILGKPDFNDLTFTLNGTPIFWGTFLTVLINFLIVAVVVFFVIKAISAVTQFRKAADEEAAEAEMTELELLTQIRDALVGSGGTSSSSDTPTD